MGKFRFSPGHCGEGDCVCVPPGPTCLCSDERPGGIPATLTATLSGGVNPTRSYTLTRDDECNWMGVCAGGTPIPGRLVPILHLTPALADVTIEFYLYDIVCGNVVGGCSFTSGDMTALTCNPFYFEISWAAGHPCASIGYRKLVVTE